MHCLFGGTTKQFCDIGKVCVVFVLLKWPIAWDWDIVCFETDYLFRRNLNGDFFHNTESNQKLLNRSLLWNMHRLTVRIVEVYIFYSLNLWACFCISFSNLVKLFLCPAKIFWDFCCKTKYSSCQSYFSEVCQKSKCLCTWLHHFIWTSVHK